MISISNSNSTLRHFWKRNSSNSLASWTCLFPTTRAKVSTQCFFEKSSYAKFDNGYLEQSLLRLEFFSHVFFFFSSKSLPLANRFADIFAGSLLRFFSTYACLSSPINRSFCLRLSFVCHFRWGMQSVRLETNATNQAWRTIYRKPRRSEISAHNAANAFNTDVDNRLCDVVLFPKWYVAFIYDRSASPWLLCVNNECV